MSARGGAFAVFLFGLYMFAQLEARLHVGYYDKKCPAAESIVRNVIREALKEDIGGAADFLRMHFHDCFVRGCDGSILLDSTKHNKAEKDSPINNPSLEGFDVIDKAKFELEAECKGVVSCSDIIAFAARDSVHMVGGPFYEVPSGRRDGRVSKRSETFKFLPPPSHDLKQLTKAFAIKGFTQEEMVTLSGAHTIGKSHCGAFDSRLYNFSESERQDPSLDPTFAAGLKKQCPGGEIDANLTVPLDATTPDAFDNSYFRNILSRRVPFASDQSLVSSAKTKAQVEAYAIDKRLFFRDFAAAMTKLGKTDVKTGNHGEIRRHCRVIN